MTTIAACDFHDNAAWKALKTAWERYCARPTAENRRGYFGAAVPRWRRERNNV